MKIPSTSQRWSRLGLTQLLFLITLAAAHAGSAIWSQNPASDDWKTATNWMPNTVPEDPDDVATFSFSNQTDVTVRGDVELDSIVFDSNASAYSITVQPGGRPANPNQLTISGVGIMNNSGTTQNFVSFAVNSKVGEILFTDSASAGSDAVYTTLGLDSNFFPGGQITFFDSSSAGDATFINNGAAPGFGSGFGSTTFTDTASAGTATIVNNHTIGGTYGATYFNGSSSAANATFFNDGGFIQITNTATAGNGSFTINGRDGSNNLSFFVNARAGNGTFTAHGGAVSGAVGGVIHFGGDATADHGAFTIEGGGASAASGALVEFNEESTAANSTFVINGAAESGAGGGRAVFYWFDAHNGNPTAANASLTANGGSNGGSGGAILFQGNSFGGTASVAVFGNANIDISDRLSQLSVTIGSLEGDGFAFLGASNLTIGSNNLSKIFAGAIQDEGGVVSGSGGSLSKIGTGTLTLTGASTYTGGTTVAAGTLAVTNSSGSATGTGLVQVNAGTLGGSGRVTGAVTIGTGSGGGAFLAPALGSPRQATFRTRGLLTFHADATYTYTFKARNAQARTDQVIANGVTINGGASITLQGTVQDQLQPGLVLTVISNTSPNPISGTFSNLPDGAIVSIGGNNFEASYTGGDGNDLTLTVVP